MNSVHLLKNPAESVIHEFPRELIAITPKSPQWSKRVELEIKNVISYINYLKLKQNALWFVLKPADQAKRYNYQRWDGKLKIPARPDIQFDIRIVLTSLYPKVFPRAFAEESIQLYCGGNIYPKNIWRDNATDSNDKRFVQLCHDHMTEQSAWHPKYSIAHFFIREVWYWWTAKSNRIINEWDKIHYNKNET